MAETDKQAAFAKEYQERFEKKLRESEISILEYWKEHLHRVLGMRPEGIAALQLQVKRVSDMMENRIRVLKKV
jgi:hypothetical protein